jgi:hypothetical protein
MIKQANFNIYSFKLFYKQHWMEQAYSHFNSGKYKDAYK